MRCLLCSLLMVLLLAATPAQAETLLAEIGWNQPNPITLPAGFSFRAVDPITTEQATISSALLTPDQLEVTTIEADPSGIALFNRVLAESNSTLRRAYISNDEQVINPPFGHTSFEAIWAPDFDPSDGLHTAAYVPQLGNAFFGYWLTSVKQVITPAGQTVYFYGNVIPEPSGLTLMLMGGVLHLSRCSRRSRL